MFYLDTKCRFGAQLVNKVWWIAGAGETDILVQPYRHFIKITFLDSVDPKVDIYNDDSKSISCVIIILDSIIVLCEKLKVNQLTVDVLFCVWEQVH